jgi:GIY-YIG catalytic domain.
MSLIWKLLSIKWSANSHCPSEYIKSPLCTLNIVLKFLLVLDVFNCNTLYIGWTNNNFKTRFKQHRRNIICAEETSTVMDRLIQIRHEMRNIEQTVTTLKTEYKLSRCLWNHTSWGIKTFWTFFYPLKYRK